MRKALSTTRYVDPHNKNVTFDIMGRWTVGYGNWTGIWGSKGDGAAYSS